MLSSALLLLASVSASVAVATPHQEVRAVHVVIEVLLNEYAPLYTEASVLSADAEKTVLVFPTPSSYLESWSSEQQYYYTKYGEMPSSITTGQPATVTAGPSIYEYVSEASTRGMSFSMHISCAIIKSTEAACRTTAIRSDSYDDDATTEISESTIIDNNMEYWSAVVVEGADTILAQEAAATPTAADSGSLASSVTRGAASSHATPTTAPSNAAPTQTPGANAPPGEGAASYKLVSGTVAGVALVVAALAF